MIDGVEHVSNLTTRYTILEAIYLDISTHEKPAAQDQLQASITKLYVAILAYLAKARRYYHRRTAGKQAIPPPRSTPRQVTEFKQSG